MSYESPSISHFTAQEKRQDLFLGIAFLLITSFSSVRIYRNWSPTGGRKVITMFNLLIFIASAIRTVWFLLPNDFLESSYTPGPEIAFVSKKWFGTLISEILLVTGSLSLYGIFILVACYWVNMLQKLNSNVGNVPVATGFARFKAQHLGAIETFGIIMSIIIAVQMVSIGLFLSKVFNSEQMILFDAIMLSVVSLAVVAEITILSMQIRRVLENLEVINNRNSQPQIRRIFAIIVVANVFFVTRVILEVTLAVSMIRLMQEKHSIAVVMSDKYWSLYILLKHLCEVVVLTLELIISTAIKSYDAGSRAPGQPLGQQQQQQHGGVRVTNMNSNTAGSSGGVGGPRSANTVQYTQITSSHAPTSSGGGGGMGYASYGATAGRGVVVSGALPTGSNTAANAHPQYNKTATTGTTGTANPKKAKKSRGSTGSSGGGGGAAGGGGGYTGSEGVELTTERTPMLHLYDASGANEV